VAAHEPENLECIRDALGASVPPGSDSLDAVARNVVFDSVLEVSVSAFSGQVYSIQTGTGWYFADSIISHNCTSIPIVPGVENPQMEPVQSWFDRQSEQTKLVMMGPQRLDLYQSGRVSFSDLGHRVQNPTWGPSPQVVPVKDLAVAQVAAA